VALPSAAAPRPSGTGAPARRAGASTGAVNRIALDTARRLLWLFADATLLSGRSYYDVLGVAPTALPVEIQAACESIRRAFELERPPLGALDSVDRVAAVVQYINEIEVFLTDPARRARYDRDR
jgi:hypothetical protein